MIGLGYVKAKSFETTASASVREVIAGRCALLSVATHSKAVGDVGKVSPLAFKNGSGGDVLYKVQPWASVSDSGFLVSHHIVGGAGILFDDGLYLDAYQTDGDFDPGVDYMVLFYT